MQVKQLVKRQRFMRKLQRKIVRKASFRAGGTATSTPAHGDFAPTHKSGKATTEGSVLEEPLMPTETKNEIGTVFNQASMATWSGS